MSKSSQSAIERLMGFTLTLVIVLHSFGCIWVCLGKDPQSWITTKSGLLPRTDEGSLYLAAVYWALTTFATIGYGDITGSTTQDYVFTMFVFVTVGLTMCGS